jgi:enoyl-CoA hydratase
VQLAAQGQDILFNFVENLKIPVIAAVNGFALGGGLELAWLVTLECLRQCQNGLARSVFRCYSGYGGTQRLPQLIGKGRAMEMIMTAGMVTADEAYRTGLVNHVVPQRTFGIL